MLIENKSKILHFLNKLKGAIIYEDRGIELEFLNKKSMHLDLLTFIANML